MDEQEQGPAVVGRGLSKIPCFRNTFLASITSGLSATLATFLFTSKTRKSIKVGLWTYTGVTICYWFHCRYNHAVQKFNNQKITSALLDYQMKEATGRNKEE